MNKTLNMDDPLSNDHLSMSQEWYEEKIEV